MEHVLATSTLSQVKSQNFLIRVDGALYPDVTSKDIVLRICGVIGTQQGPAAQLNAQGAPSVYCPWRPG